MAIDFSVQSLQFRRRNGHGKMTLRYVWDVISRTDATTRMLIESWGGKPDGYIKTFRTDLLLGKYLSGRIAKSSMNALDENIDLEMVGDAEYSVIGPLKNLGKALEASNHEKAKLRLQIVGADDAWDSEACFNKTMFGIIDLDDETVTCNQLNQGMASRVKATFKSGGKYADNILAIDEFMTSAKDDLADVLGGEPVSHSPMDGDRIKEIIQLADGLRDKMVASSVTTIESKAEIHIPEPSVIRGSEWGGWA